MTDSADTPTPLDAEPIADADDDVSEVIAPTEVTPGNEAGGADGDAGAVPSGDSITEPAKVMRIGGMVKQLLEEVRNTDLDDASRERLAEVYERSIIELSTALSPDLQEELRLLALPFGDESVPSDAELRIAKAQLVGWLEGLFHGIQASLMAQQFAAQQQLQQMRQLPQQGGRPGVPGAPGEGPPQTGTYL
ncbi:MAG: proteasome activator [Actinomycetota bacterium]